MPRRFHPAPALLALALFLAPVARGHEGHAPAADAHPPAATAHEPAAGPHGEAANTPPNILELKPELALTTLIVFLVLLGVLSKFAWGPLSKALHDREHAIEHSLEQAELARAEGERMLAEHRNQMAQAADEVRKILEEARRDAQATADEIVRKAQAEAEASRQRAEREISTAKDQALLEIWSKTADLAVSVAGKVLTREMNDGDRRRLVEVAMNELPASANGQGGR